MTKVEIERQALKLSEQDRFDLAHSLWASLDGPGSFPESAPLPNWQKQLLDDRLAASVGEEGEDWEQVKGLGKKTIALIQETPPCRNPLPSARTSTS